MKLDPNQVTGPFFGLDLETRDDKLKTHGPGWAFDDGGYPVGYAVAWFEGDPDKLTKEDLLDHSIEQHFKSVYLGVRHEGGGNLPEAEVRAFIQPLLADKNRVAVGANMGYDYGWTLRDGYEWLCDIDDVQIQAPLLDDARRSYSLNSLLKDKLGSQKNEDKLQRSAEEFGIKDVKAQLWRLPAGLVADYARDDAARALRLYFYQRLEMREMDLERVWRVELDLIPVLYRMRKRGVRVDEERVQHLRDYFMSKEQGAVDKLKDLTGRTLDAWTSGPLIQALMDEGVPQEDFPLTPKKRELSLDNVFLKKLASVENKAGQVAQEILTLRRYNKARSTFVDGMLLDHMVNGRIHSELRALRGDEGGTVSGRFSGSSPSLQVVPARDPELGPLVRSAFIPEEGEEWCSIDYSSQEPRLAVHFGVKAGIPGAEELQRAWINNPREDAYLPTAKLCNIPRKDAKIIKLGILYGMGGGKMCHDLGLPYEIKFWKGKEIMVAGPEGEELFRRYHEGSPMDKALSEMAQRVAKQRGSVRTLLGRRAYFHRQANGQVWFTHKALNRIIQGSAADMTKVAMLKVDAAGHTPLVSVHDELGFSVNRERAKETSEMLADLMSGAIPLEVPVVCDVELGPSWGVSMLNKPEEDFWTREQLINWGK